MSHFHQPAFVASSCFLLPSRSSPLAPRVTFPRHHFPVTSRPRSRVHSIRRPQCALNDYNQDDGGIPNSIDEMDNLERERRESLPQNNRKRTLSHEEEEAFLDSFPGLRAAAEKLEAKVTADPLSPGDWRIYSRVYSILSPSYPRRLFQLLLFIFTAFSARMGIVNLRARFTGSELLMLFMDVEHALQWSILSIAVALLAFLRLFYRASPRADCVVRTLTMYSLSSILLLPTAAVAATAHPTSALCLGVFVRLAMQLPALWFWTDLRKELVLKSDAFVRVFRAWRLVATLLVALPAIAVRAAALAGKLSLREAVAARASAIRTRLGTMFPVMLSLFNDPRGLFLAASIVIVLSVAHLVYLYVFVSPLLRVHEHRKCNSWFIRTLVRAGWYLPNVHPEEEALRSTAPDPQENYRPSRAMLLRHGSSFFQLDSSYLSTEASMPIFSHLDKEDEILRQEGAEYWIRPMEEDLPYNGSELDVDRAIDILKNWARPLSGDQKETKFEDFFETLTEEEYQYDVASGNWVFDEKMMSENDVEKGSTSLPNSENLELIGPGGDDNIMVNVPAELEPWLRKFAERGLEDPSVVVPKELEPWLQKFVQDTAKQNKDILPKEFEPWLKDFVEEGDEDDSNEPPVTVFV